MINNFSLYKKALAGFLLIELFSFYAYYIPQLATGFFWLLIMAFLAITLWRFEYGVLIVLAELFIGSKGYLFFTQIGEFKLSIRIAFWSIIMLIWLIRFAIDFWQRQTWKKQIETIKNTKFASAFELLFVAILWGTLSGWFHQANFTTVFLDANAWIYFALIFPLYQIRKVDNLPDKIWSIFWAATTWLSLKTLFLLYIFSHGQTLLIYSLYQWVRNTGIGEITQIDGGFYRVFLQSQIFNLLGLFIAWCYLIKRGAQKQLLPYLREKQTKIFTIFLTLNLITVLLSFSRSFWVGAGAGFIALIVWLFIQPADKNVGYLKNILHAFKITLFTIAIAITLSVALIGSTITFPWPRPTGGFSATDIFSERLTDTNESAIGSRWSLLPKLWSQIKANPILGQGFGAPVTYKSQDPRVIKISPDGNYTTSAFEWGWLDIWLKLGIFGLLFYLFILYKISREDWQNHNTAKTLLPRGSLAICTIILLSVHIFTPYLNHPLGIGFLLIAAALLDSE